MTEKQLQDKLIRYLKKHEIPYLKTTGGLSYFPAGPVKPIGPGQYSGTFRALQQQKGWSDLLIFVGKSVMFVELKTEIGQLRDSQKEKQALLEAHGYMWITLRPSKYDELIKILDDYLEIKKREHVMFGKL